MTPLVIRHEHDVTWDLVALGEVMLRFDPGEDRITTARTFRVWEGGGEYNVARGLRHCFGLRSAIVTALADNPVGHLVEGLMREGGVDLRYLRWVPYDGVGRAARIGLNFTERGFGARAAIGMSDRGHSATSRLRPGDIDWDAVFGTDGARWFHCGGIFAALSESTPLVAREAMEAARHHGVVVSYDLNYRASLWQSIGGQARARAVNRELAPLVDVMLGNEEDFTAALGFEVPGLDPNLAALDGANFARMIDEATRTFPNLRVVATTLRNARTATRNDWGAICWADGRLYRPRPDRTSRSWTGWAAATRLPLGSSTRSSPTAAPRLRSSTGQPTARWR